MALGKRRRIWSAFEEQLARITDRRQAAYFDLCVEHGIAAARATMLAGRRGTLNALAHRVVRDLMH